MSLPIWFALCNQCTTHLADSLVTFLFVHLARHERDNSHGVTDILRCISVNAPALLVYLEHLEHVITTCCLVSVSFVITFHSLLFFYFLSECIVYAHLMLHFSIGMKR